MNLLENLKLYFKNNKNLIFIFNNNSPLLAGNLINCVILIYNNIQEELLL